MSIYSRLHTSAGGRLVTTSFGKGKERGRSGRKEYSIPSGENTRMVYGMIRDGELREVKDVLLDKLDNFPRNRAALSLLGYVCYQLEEFGEACGYFEQIMEVVPKSESYKLYYAQSLYKSGRYDSAISWGSKLMSDKTGEKTFSFVSAQSNKIIGYSNYEKLDFVAAKRNISNGLSNDPDILVLQGSIFYKERDTARALKEYSEANTLDARASIKYNMALCFYGLKIYPRAFKIIDAVIHKGAEEHPELSVFAGADGTETQSVGNSLTLRSTSLIETFNLKFAIDYVHGEFDNASSALKEMPPRKVEELDGVTLHNKALLQMETDPTEGFKKLKHLLGCAQFPEETFPNLLMLYCKYSYYSEAADALGANTQLFEYLTPDFVDFINAICDSQDNPADGYDKLEEIGLGHIDRLRKITKDIQNAKVKQNAEDLKNSLKMFTEAQRDYLPVLMHMARIYWDIENYEEVEKILLKSEEFCGEMEVWKLNLAHAYFMQETPEKFKLAMHLYLKIVDRKRSEEKILEVPPMVLGNLCVTYIMTAKNPKAETIMREVEKAETDLSRKYPDKQYLHFCIINLVIGTLYCSKMTEELYEFGIARVMKALDPIAKKMMTDTWFYSKRAFLSLLESLVKHMVVIKDELFEAIIKFFDDAATCGKKIDSTVSSVVDSGGADAKSMSYSGGLMKDFDETEKEEKKVAVSKERRTVYYEARTLKQLFLEHKYD